MKVLKLAIVVVIAFGVWFQFVGNTYETGRWRLREKCGGISSDRVRAMWVSAQIAPLNVSNDDNRICEHAMVTYNDMYRRLFGVDIVG